MRCFVCVGILTALVTAACGAAPAPPKSSQHALLAKPLPKFRSVTLQGAPLRPAAFEGRVVVVEFFAKDCEPCQHGLPELATLARERVDIADETGTIRWFGGPDQSVGAAPEAARALAEGPR